MDARPYVSDDNATTNQQRTNNRRRRGFNSGGDRGDGPAEGNNRSSLGRKVATDAINNSSGSTMGASVYIADTITNTINFIF